MCWIQGQGNLYSVCKLKELYVFILARKNKAQILLLTMYDCIGINKG